MSPLGVVVVPPVRAVEDDVPTDVLVTGVSDVILGSLVLIETGPVLRVLPIPVVLTELTELDEPVVVIVVGV